MNCSIQNCGNNPQTQETQFPWFCPTCYNHLMIILQPVQHTLTLVVDDFEDLQMFFQEQDDQDNQDLFDDGLRYISECSQSKPTQEKSGIQVKLQEPKK